MLPGLADCTTSTINGESSSTGNKDSEAHKDARAIASASLHGTGNTDSLPYGTLSKLPREVRNMIYINVLSYEKRITKPYIFLDHHLPIMAEDWAHAEAIDAALLRTSKAIYYEAIRILYGRNSFYFCKPSDITEFAHADLGSTPFGYYDTTSKPSATIQNAHSGRLTMIRSLHLKLGSEHSGDDIKKLWSYWYDFFYPPEKQDQLVEFPALELLALDLTDWKLNAKDASKVRVRPYHSHYLPFASAVPVSRRSVSPVRFWTVKRPPSRSCLTRTRFD